MFNFTWRVGLKIMGNVKMRNRRPEEFEYSGRVWRIE